MSRSLFWLSDETWAATEPRLPKAQPGAWMVDYQRVISGIIQMLKCGGRWAYCAWEWDLSTTSYNRWIRWSRRGIWTRIRQAGKGALLFEVAQGANDRQRSQVRA